MKNCETINSSVVLVYKNNIIINNAQQPIQLNNPFMDLANKIVLNNLKSQSIKIDNPFMDLANKIVLNNAYNTEFSQMKTNMPDVEEKLHE